MSLLLFFWLSTELCVKSHDHKTRGAVILGKLKWPPAFSSLLHLWKLLAQSRESKVTVKTRNMGLIQAARGEWHVPFFSMLNCCCFLRCELTSFQTLPMPFQYSFFMAQIFFYKDLRDVFSEFYVSFKIEAKSENSLLFTRKFRVTSLIFFCLLACFIGRLKTVTTKLGWGAWIINPLSSFWLSLFPT